MRDRWFGATGRKVPEIVVEGTVDLEGALVLDALDDAALRRAHDEGRPVAVRAGDADAVASALARPEVSCAVIPPERPELLDLDLTEMTYG